MSFSTNGEKAKKAVEDTTRKDFSSLPYGKLNKNIRNDLKVAGKKGVGMKDSKHHSTGLIMLIIEELESTTAIQ